VLGQLRGGHGVGGAETDDLASLREELPQQQDRAQARVRQARGLEEARIPSLDVERQQRGLRPAG